MICRMRRSAKHLLRSVRWTNTPIIISLMREWGLSTRWLSVSHWNLNFVLQSEFRQFTPEKLLKGRKWTWNFTSSKPLLVTCSSLQLCFQTHGETDRFWRRITPNSIARCLNVNIYWAVPFLQQKNTSSLTLCFKFDYFASELFNFCFFYCWNNFST